MGCGFSQGRGGYATLSGAGSAGDTGPGQHGLLAESVFARRNDSNRTADLPIGKSPTDRPRMADLLDERSAVPLDAGTLARRHRAVMHLMEAQDATFSVPGRVG